MRRAGILMPIFSLASPYGIGTFSKEAYEFIDFLKEAGQSCWQILPIGPTGYGDSPYSSTSTFAGNPYLIDPVQLSEEGLLLGVDLAEYPVSKDKTKVDYGNLFPHRYLLLKKAYDRFVEKGGLTDEAYNAFKDKEAYWLDDYALFMSLKHREEGRCWLDWPKELRSRDEEAIMKARKELDEMIEFFCFMQYEFAKQWKKLHAYATEKGIELIGDIPFFVSLDSCDVWSHPEVFEIDEEHNVRAVAGTADGQIWGNPVYDWKALKEDHYAWWIARLRYSLKFYDILRIDHFNGFLSCFAVPFGDKDVKNGKLEKGPGMDFFQALKKELGEIRLIAEDLGVVTEESQKLLKDTGIPGMKILQFAFTSWDSIYMPHKLTPRSVVYTGNHDNPTLRTWAESLNEGSIGFARKYIRSYNTDYNGFVWDMIREAYHTPSDLCIIPIGDYLCLGEEGRINTPGTIGENWKWRLKPNFLSKELAAAIREITSTYSRLPRL